MGVRRIPTELEDLVLFEPDVHGDERGFFVETFRGTWMNEFGIEAEFVQQNHSRSVGRVVRGIIQGESHPPQFIPRLVDLLMQGKMAVDRMMTFYPLRDINQAARDSSAGATIKPVLRMPH